MGEGRLGVTANAEKVVVTIRENSATFPYDGEAKTAEGYEVAGISSALYKEGDFAFVGDAAHKVATGTDAGDYDMGLLPGDFENTSANFSNVAFAIEDGQLHIVPVAIDEDAVTWDARDVQKVYDGGPFPPTARAPGTSTATALLGRVQHRRRELGGRPLEGLADAFRPSGR